MDITTQERQKINKFLTKFNGYKTDEQIREMWEGLNNLNLFVGLLQNGKTSYNFTIDNKEVNNSLFIFKTYNEKTNKTEFLIYVS